MTAEHGRALWHGCIYGLLQADPAARELVGRCRAVAEQLDDDFLRARAVFAEAFDAALWVDSDQALALYERAIEQLAATGDLFLLAAVRCDTSAFHAARGEPARALEEAEQGLRALEHIPQERWVRNYLLIMKVLCLWTAGEPDRSRELGQSVLPSIVEQGETMGIAAVTEYLSWVACSKEEHVLATLLLGGAGALWRKVGTLLWSEPGLTRLHNDIERTLMLSLGAERFTDMYAQGARLSIEELVDVACGRTHGPKGAEDGSPLGPLTARERQVARLIAEGLGNRQIAERLVISKRTADAHVEHILSKLGFDSRHQVRAMVAGLKEE